MKALLLLLLAAVAPARSQSARDERWRQDLQAMLRTASTVHPNLFSVASRDAFESEAAALDAAIPQKTDAEVVLGLQRLLAMAGDVHTSLSLFQAGSPVRRYPLRLYWFQDGLYVTDAAAAWVRALGRRLVRIEDTPVEEAVAKLRPLVSAENDWRVRSVAPSLLVSPEALAFAGIAPTIDDPVRFTFAASGGEFTIALTPAPASLFSLPHKARPAPPLYRRNSERYYWFDYLEASRTIYVKYNAAQESPVLSMPAFLDEIGAFTDDHPYRNVVIDVRNNQGGSSLVIQPLVQALAGAIAAGALARERVFVVIGRDTVSSGMIAAIDLKRIGATLVGEPTGNRPNHFGNIASYTLPNSGLNWSCSTRTLTFPEYRGDALPPDVEVLLGAADYFDERDPVLEKILAGLN